MGQVLAALLVAALVSSESRAQTCPPGDEVPFSQASRCLGETRQVIGRIDHVSISKTGMLFVNFCVNWRACPFTAVVFKEKVPAFDGIGRYVGAEVAISGKVISFQGHTQIVLESLDQIVVRAPPNRRGAGVERDPAPSLPTRVSPSPEQVTKPSDEGVAPAPKAVHWVADAKELVGTHVRLKGFVGAITTEGGELVVHFRRGIRPLEFVAIVAEPDVERLGAIVQAWANRFVELEGDVLLIDGRPAIFLRDEAQAALRPAIGPRALP